jgi:protein TonB
MVQPPAPPPQPTPPPPPLKEDPKPKGETRGPQITRQSKPAYPPDAKDDGVEGTVVLLLTIDRSGDVSRVKMENGSGDKRLDKAAEQTVRQWAYSPSLRDGEPVEATIRVRVQFRIE